MVPPCAFLKWPTSVSYTHLDVYKRQRQQQIVRVDREKLLPLTNDELIEVEQRLRDLAPNLDAIILEDYGKGFMTEQLMQLVAKIAAEHKLIVTVDPSPRNPCLLYTSRCV